MIPLQLGIRAHDLGAIPITELTQKMKQYDFSHAHFAIRKSFPESAPTIFKMTPGTGRYYRNHFQANQQSISILGCYVNIVDTDEAKRRQAIQEFKHHIHLAHDFGAAMVATETGSVGDGYTTANFTEEAYQRARESVAEMVEEAERFGVTVAIEAGINHPIHSVEGARRLVDDIQSPNLKLIVDCANLMSVENYERQAEVVEQAFTVLDDVIIALHIKDFIVEENRIKIVPVGQGWMNYEPILRYAKYQKPHIFTSLEATTEPHLEASVRLIRETYDRI